MVVNGRSQEKGEKVVAALYRFGAYAVFLRADLTDKHQAQRLVPRAAEHFGGLDILVNNAQVVPQLAPAQAEVDDELLDVALRSGLYVSLWTGQAALPWFIRAGGGRIVNFASVNGVYGSRFGLEYNAAKEGIRGLPRTLANEWGHRNVTVNVVLPSCWSSAYEPFYGDDVNKNGSRRPVDLHALHGRTQEEIGSVVLGLVAETGRFVTGQPLSIDGSQNLLGLP